MPIDPDRLADLVLAAIDGELAPLKGQLAQLHAELAALVAEHREGRERLAGVEGQIKMVSAQVDVAAARLDNALLMRAFETPREPSEAR